MTIRTALPPEILPVGTGRSLPWLSGGLGLAVVALVCTLFVWRFTELYTEYWSIDEDYSHWWMVPLISAVLAWSILRRQGRPHQGSLAGGLFWMGIGALFRLSATVVGWPLVDWIALAAFLYGLAVLLGGRSWASALIFPLLYLFFMFPLSPTLTDTAALWLQGATSMSAGFALRLFVPVYQEGNILQLPGHHLQIGHGCAGLRQVLIFFAISLLIAYWSRRGLLFRAVIVLAALPVAVGANLLRVLVMAFLACHFGPESISENRDLVAGVSYHAAWGLLTWLVGLGLFLGVLWWLSRAFPSDEGGGTRNEGRDKTGSFPVPRSSSLAPRLGVAVVFLATTLGLQLLLQGHLRAAEPGTGTGLKRPLAGFPASLGKWMVPEAMAETSARSVMLLGSPLGQGPLQAASALFPHRTVPDEIPTDLEALNHYNKATDRLNRYYIAPAGEPGQWVECQLWMIHSSDGGDRRHHPRICFQVAGFTEDSARRETCLFDDQSASPVRFCFTRGNSCRYVYYWHYTFEPSEGEELTALQRLSQECGVRRPSLTVEIFTDAQNPVHLGEVGKFVEVVDRQLKDYLPPGARRGSDTLPVRQLQVQDGKASHRG